MRDFVFPMMRANARYEGDYLLGTSIARPLISKRLVEIAHETGADAIAHGATGGNDQVRLNCPPMRSMSIRVIAPWREWELTNRTALIAWAEKRRSPCPKTSAARAPSPPTRTCCHVRGQGA